MLATYFVLTLYCLSCQPLQVFSIHGIPAFSGGSSQWADRYCMEMGDVLGGDYERRNMANASVLGSMTAAKARIIYSCQKESDEI